jgi:hypothetical protein
MSDTETSSCAADRARSLRDGRGMSGNIDVPSDGHLELPARGNLDRDGVHVLTAYVAGV